MNLAKLTLEDFIAATASEEAVPGGGSVSALCSALSAALATMVCRLTSGKKKYADVQPRIDAILEKIAPMAYELLRNVDLDSQAYDEVFQAYKLPKDTDEQKAGRTACIQKALRVAASVPMTVACCTAAMLPMLEELSVIGNRNAVTDVYVAVQCARTAVLGASANVRINLLSITDAEYTADALAKVKELECAAIATEERVRTNILNEI